MKRYKILFLDHLPFIGGAQLALVRHLNFLDLEKFELVMASPDPSFIERSLNSGRLSEVRLHRISFGRLKSRHIRSFFNFLKSSWAVLKIAYREKPDLIVANTERTLYASILSRVVLGIPLFIFIRDFEFSKGLLSRASIFIGGFACVSRSIRDYYFAKGNPKAAVVYVGTDLSIRLGRIRPAEVVDLKERFGIKEDFIIGFIGRLVDWKNPLILPDIASILLKEPSCLSWKFVVVGEGRGQEGNVEEELRKKIIDLHLEDKFYLAGFWEETAVWYKIISLLLHCSQKPEPFATVVVEALTAGLPVIAVKLGGTVEILKNGDNGFLAENRPLEFYKIILRLMKDKKLLEEVKSHAFETANDFSESKITKQIEALYLNLLGGVK